MNKTRTMCTSNSNGNCYCGVVGFRFSPSDEEILGYYLWHKMIGNDDLTLAISEVQLLQWEPWQLPSQSAIKSDDHVWFFFCRRDKKYANSQRDNRKTKKGFWKVTENDRTIRARDTNKPIGTKKTLVYHEGRSSNAVGTNWVIHEYKLTADIIPPNPRDFVVCRLEGKPDEKNSPPRKGECGSSTASTSNNKAANNALPERDPHLEGNTGPFFGNNAMDYELAVQASMDEQGLFEERGLFVGERQNPKENEFNYEDILIFDTASNDSAAGTSYRRNFHESAQKDTSITTRNFKSQYQPGCTPLTQKAPKSIQLKSGFSSKNTVSRDKSNKGSEMDHEKKTKEDSSRRSSKSTGSNRGGSSIFKETIHSTSTPSPPWVSICKVILGVTLFAIIIIDGVGRR